jgi:putative intracellular protease/amidase
MGGRDVYLFVFDGLADWEIGYATAGINGRHWQRQPERYDLRTVAYRQTPVTTAGGLRVLPDLTIDSIFPESAAMLILPGGTAWEQGGNKKALELARTFLGAGVPVAAICGAVLGLARAELLDDVEHTGNSAAQLATTGYGGGDFYRDRAAVTDSNVITAGGIAPIDFAREIFAKLDLYEPSVLEAWYGLFRTGKPEYLAALSAA